MSQIQNKTNQLIENRATARLGGGREAYRRPACEGQVDGAGAPRSCCSTKDASRSSTCSCRHRCYELRHGRSQHFDGDGVVTGHGTIGRPSGLRGRRRTSPSRRGSLSLVDGREDLQGDGSWRRKERRALHRASTTSGGARIQEGVDALAGYGEIFQRNVMSSRACGSADFRQSSAPAPAGPSTRPALTDFIGDGEGDIVHVPHRPRRS